jgi:hypothetical protein
MMSERLAIALIENREPRAPIHLRSIGTACIALLLLSAAVVADEYADARTFADCSAYFFMAANAKSMGEFSGYYESGEYAYNRAVQLLGERQALDRFNSTSSEINELIERDWSAFGKADDRYEVVCGDVFREARNPDR